LFAAGWATDAAVRRDGFRPLAGARVSGFRTVAALEPGLQGEREFEVDDRW
jgi:hypothetical protein